MIQLETRPIVDNTQHDLQVFGSRCSLAPSHRLEDPRPTQAVTHARRSVLHALVGFVVAKLLLISCEITAHRLANQAPNFAFERQDRKASMRSFIPHTPLCHLWASPVRLAIMPQGFGWRSSSGWAKLAAMRRALL